MCKRLKKNQKISKKEIQKKFKKF